MLPVSSEDLRDVYMDVARMEEVIDPIQYAEWGLDGVLSKLDKLVRQAEDYEGASS